MADLEQFIEKQNRGMIAFDFLLATGAMLAPDATLKVLGHDDPSDDARELFRRNSWIWYTFSAGHAVAAARGRKQDWWALSWLRGTEWFTDVIWSRSKAVARPGASEGMQIAGAANLAMSLAYAWMATRRR